MTRAFAPFGAKALFFHCSDLSDASPSARKSLLKTILSDRRKRNRLRRDRDHDGVRDHRSTHDLRHDRVRRNIRGHHRGRGRSHNRNLRPTSC